jgi:hypothetical protein
MGWINKWASAVNRRSDPCHVQTKELPNKEVPGSASTAFMPWEPKPVAACAAGAPCPLAEPRRSVPRRTAAGMPARAGWKNQVMRSQSWFPLTSRCNAASRDFLLWLPVPLSSTVEDVGVEPVFSNLQITVRYD